MMSVCSGSFCSRSMATDEKPFPTEENVSMLLWQPLSGGNASSPKHEAPTQHCRRFVLLRGLRMNRKRFVERPFLPSILDHQLTVPFLRRPAVDHMVLATLESISKIILRSMPLSMLDRIYIFKFGYWILEFGYLESNNRIKKENMRCNHNLAARSTRPKTQDPTTQSTRNTLVRYLLVSNLCKSARSLIYHEDTITSKLGRWEARGRGSAGLTPSQIAAIEQETAGPRHGCNSSRSRDQKGQGCGHRRCRGRCHSPPEGGGEEGREPRKTEENIAIKGEQAGGRICGQGC